MAVPGDLRICRELVNPHFDGYKLSLDPLPTYTKSLINGIDVTKLTDEQFSYHHAKLLASHNHLIPDPWAPLTAYFIDKDWCICRAAGVNTGNRIDVSDSLFEVPEAANLKLKPGRFNLSLKFACDDLAVLSDGVDKLYLLETTNRKEGSTPWKCVFSKSVLGEEKSFLIGDSVYHVENDTHRVECLLVTVQEKESEPESVKSPFFTSVEWITLASVDRKTWSLERSRCLEGSKPFDYLALDRGGNSVLVAASKRYKMVLDSIKPVQAETEEWEVVGKEDQPLPEYTWSQDSEDVHVTFIVPSSVAKADVYMSLRADHLEFGIKNSTVLLKGTLHAEVDVDSSTWTIEGQQLVLSLNKKNESAWPTVVVGDNRGELVMDPDQLAQIHERLAAYTSDKLNPPPEEDSDKPYNTQQLEDCDASSEDSAWFMRFDGETHRVSNEVYLSSHQFLFTVRLDADKTCALCLRYDCDGSLWQPDVATSKDNDFLKHVGMLHALGYVQASKVQRKFSSCSPDLSYAVIADITRHIYIYRQNMPIASPLRNRKTGRQVNAVAKQQVVSLDTTDDIVGLHAMNDRLLILTCSSLYTVMLNTEE